MLECDYEVKQIDGDYAHLQRIDRPEEELKLPCAPQISALVL